MRKKNHSIFYIVFIDIPLRAIMYMFRILALAGIVIGLWVLLQTVGVLTVRVPVSGASMLPTFPEEGWVQFQRYFHNPSIEKILPQSIQKKDIVVFENDKTHEVLAEQEKDSTGFVKRVIGTSGDTVEIRDGFVYVNGERLSEEYTLKPRSTFGGTIVQDCRPVTVPEDEVFVLGDNRKVSMDSRQIGTVPIADILYYIPFEKQAEKYQTLWRDPGADFDTHDQSLFDTRVYVELLNGERAKQNLKPLTYEARLERSAKLRAEKMLEYDEFDESAPKSGYTIQDAMRDVGYSNIIYGEFPMLGYYDAEELFEAFLEQKGAREFLLNNDYEDIGVSTFVGELNGCPAQVVVQHLAGYVPPNYGSGEIQKFQDAVTRLEEIRPGWERLTEFDEFYENNKKDVDRMNELIALRISRFRQIISQMESNKWLTEEQNAWVKEDARLAEEQGVLADKLNE